MGARGPKPGTVKKTGGRKKGTPNKATADIKALARGWGAEALEKAAAMAGLVEGKAGAESEQVRLGAICLILDRAYGKPQQAIVGDEDAPIKTVLEVRWAGTSASG